MLQRARQKFQAVIDGAVHAAVTLPSKRAMARRGYVSLFDHRPRDAFVPDWPDLWFLYRTVRARRPRVLMEFGSGCSSIALAQALADNAQDGAPGFLHSFDADAHWAAATERSMPEALRTFCSVAATPAEPIDYGGTPAWRYRDVPDLAPDFIYLDGPALRPDRKVAVDVLDLEAHFPSGFLLVVDGRFTNCRFLEAHFKRQYRKTFRRTLRNTSYELIG
ncbi:MAG: hypothetical protein QF578_08690 [Alphaproteobacteria bacterium]|jgi:hypothetical protein|nr:hypothetical protein [Alphaproteobacteria bacterium]MDP6811872.1 hypothetical protein [Alphaproteobacteria bacterium]